MNSDLRSISRQQWNTMSAGALAFFFDSWDAFLLIYVLSDIATEFKITIARASLAVLFTYASRWIGGLLLGSLSARYGRKKSLLFGILLCGIFTMLTGCARTFPMLLGLRFCFGIGMGGLYAAAGPLVMESVPAAVRGFASGFYMFGFYAGNVIAPWTYYALEPHFGWRGLFYFGGASLLLIPYVLLTVLESPVWEAHTNRQRPVPGVLKSARQRLSMWRLFSPAYIGVTLALLTVEFGVFFDAFPFQSLLPTYVKLERHFPIHLVSLAGSMIGAGALLGSVLGGIVSDRIGRKRTYSIAFVLAIIPTAVGVLAHQASLVIIASFINGMIFGSMGGLLTAFENEHYPIDLRAVGNGLLHNLGAFAGSVGTVIAATLHARFGYAETIMIIAAAGAGLGLLGLSFTRETRNVSLDDPAEEAVSP
ncbi:MFS transporter [Paracidobacterium acidisoli]|uniref:MFS transporter n=1 Tax=Paracidobacterium acidisoli TaxID=2303751 RepID=A0A372IUS3_9BACT|nr:MFS transporter [Paracidobacterium acidisoli]MBT9330147.1 MFS transporter [Paracidobacterium acidisoli]